MVLDRPGAGWACRVPVAGGAGPGGGAVGVDGDVPAGVVLEPVVVPTQGEQVAFAGRPRRPGRHVVEVAAVGGLAAARKPARDVAGPHQRGQPWGRSVAGRRGDVDDGAGGGVGEDPAAAAVGAEAPGPAAPASV